MHIKSFFKKYWSLIILVGILLLISVLSFVPGKYLLSNDNYSPELNPLLTIVRSLVSPAWRSYRVLGFASDSEQADIFRAGLMGGLGTFVNSDALAQIYSLISLSVGVLSVAILTRLIYHDFFKLKYENLICFFSGLIYLSTLWTAWTFNFNMMPYITQYGFLPLLLLSIYWLFRDWSKYRVLLMFLSAILFTATSVIATLFFVDLVIVAFFVVWFGWLFRYRVLRIAQVFFVFLLTQLFWLLPFVGYTFTTSSAVMDSYTNRSITADTIDLEKQMMTIDNASRFYTRLLGTTDDPSTGSMLFPQANNYMSYDFYKIFAYIPIFFSMLGLIFVVVKRKFKLIPIWLVTIVCLFLLKNQNSPVGSVYIWLQDNSHMFKEVFRWISSKLSLPYLIMLSITSCIGIGYFINFICTFLSKWIKYVFLIIFSLIIAGGSLFYAEYLFTGNLFATRATVNFPSEYYALQTYLQKDQDARIYYAPPSNNGYFREYNWGFIGSQFLGYILNNPLMDMSLSIGSSYGEHAMLELQNIYESGNVADFNDDLNRYDVKYVLIDRSLIKGRYGHEINWKVLDTYSKSWNLVWKDNFLELYQLNTENKDNFYMESLNGSTDTFARKNVKNLSITPISEKLKITDIDDNYLISDSTYVGENGFLKLDVATLNQEELPSTIFVDQDVLKVRPAIPEINGLQLKSYKSFGSLPSSANYIVVSDKIISKESISSGATIDNLWKDVNRLGYVKTSAFRAIDLSDSFKKEKAGDCSGDSYTTIPNTVTPEVLTSGFVIKGNTNLPCLSTKLNLEKEKNYVGVVNVNWESSSSVFGVCVYSGSTKKCLNNQKYFYKNSGFGQENVVIPYLISGNDDVSISLYALNSSGNTSEVTIKSISVSLASEINYVDKISEKNNTNTLSASILNGDNVSIKIPIVRGENTYAYNSLTNPSIWQPSKTLKDMKTYEVYSDNGMTQKVTGQYLNQYENLFRTVPNSEYLWIWRGKNLDNVPASLCLTYQGDDKCWVDDTFYDSTSPIITRIFSSSSQYTKLDASYNSTSYVSETGNVLQNFIVMNIPIAWKSIEFTDMESNKYQIVEASKIKGLDATYVFNSANLNSQLKLLSIPQSQSDNWIAIATSSKGMNILRNEVTINGWKQGWDISEQDFNNIYVIYWPNLLGYLGYIVIASEFVYLLVKIFTHRKYARK